MRIVVIGGSGHVGSYLIPLFISRGHEVIVVSRGIRTPYSEHPAWKQIEILHLDREKEEAAGKFGERILEIHADAVIDMICFSKESARQIVEALRGRISIYIAAGTVWIHGASVTVPTLEDENWKAFGDYGLNKLGLLEYLLHEFRQNGFPSSIFHPGHIVGPGWNPINPLGNFNSLVFSRLARGETLRFPTLGRETVHHVHASDVASLILLMMDNWPIAQGNHFHAVSEAAVSLAGYAEEVASWFGRKADLEFFAGESWKDGLSETDIIKSWDHISRSPNASIEKAKRLLGYRPRYSSFEAVRKAVDWMITHKAIAL